MKPGFGKIIPEGKVTYAFYAAFVVAAAVHIWTRHREKVKAAVRAPLPKLPPLKDGDFPPRVSRG